MSISVYKLSNDDTIPITPIVLGLNLTIPKFVNGNIKSQVFFTVSINKSLWSRTNWTASSANTSLGASFLFRVFRIFFFRIAFIKLFSSNVSLTRFMTMDSSQYLLPTWPQVVALICIKLFLFSHSKWSHNKYIEWAILENVTQYFTIRFGWLTVSNALYSESTNRPNLNTVKTKFF